MFNEDVFVVTVVHTQNLFWYFEEQFENKYFDISSNNVSILIFRASQKFNSKIHLIYLSVACGGRTNGKQCKVSVRSTRDGCMTLWNADCVAAVEMGAVRSKTKFEDF